MVELGTTLEPCTSEHSDRLRRLGAKLDELEVRSGLEGGGKEACKPDERGLRE